MRPGGWRRQARTARRHPLLLMALAVILVPWLGGCTSSGSGDTATSLTTTATSQATTSLTTRPERPYLSTTKVHSPRYVSREIVLRRTDKGLLPFGVADAAGSRLLIAGSTGICIVDADTGKTISYLPGPQKPGWFMANADLSNHWAVWYETPQQTEHEWVLYYTDTRAMQPKVLASGRSGEVQIPLFSLLGDDVVWYENRHKGSAIIGVTLIRRNLADGSAWRIAGQREPFGLPQIDGDRVWWLARPEPEGRNLVLHSADLASGKEYAPIPLRNETPLLYYPSISGDTVAWVEAGLVMPEHGGLYVRLPDDSRWRIPGTARKVRLFDNLLIYDSYHANDMEVISAIDLTAHKEWTVVESQIGEEGDSWEMAGARFRGDRTLVLQRPYREAHQLAGLEVKLIQLP